MKNYLYDYINDVDKKLKNKKGIDFNKIKDNHLIKINMFQHERLIHLIVCLFYALFTLFFVYISTFVPLFLIISIILLVILIFYVIHYFRLENGVQYLYKQYDEINKNINKK